MPNASLTLLQCFVEHSIVRWGNRQLAVELAADLCINVSCASSASCWQEAAVCTQEDAGASTDGTQYRRHTNGSRFSNRDQSVA